jgi:hypothetical protein
MWQTAVEQLVVLFIACYYQLVIENLLHLTLYNLNMETLSLFDLSKAHSERIPLVVRSKA